MAVDPELTCASPPTWCSSPALLNAAAQLDGYAAQHWVWWRLPEPPMRNIGFGDIIEDAPSGVIWHDAVQTAKIIKMMSPLNLAKLDEAKSTGRQQVGGVYRRTRPDGNGGKTQRAEVRFDDISACLRTPVGGSSRQVVMVVEGKSVRTRLLSPREAARLMGLDESYELPSNYNEAYHLLGDGVGAPVAGWLSSVFLTKLPLAATSESNSLIRMKSAASASMTFHLPAQAPVELSSIELCAGGGGQALGVELAGFEHCALVENDPHCCATLRLNRPKWNVLEQSLVDFSALKFTNVDLVAGGLPCPPFSKAGKQLGADDERNMFPHGLRVVREARPKAVFFENVRGMLDPVFDGYREHISSELQQLGYWVEWKLLHAADFGVPQLRPRVVMVALRNGLEKNFQWPVGNRQLTPSVGSALHDLMAANGWKGAESWRAKADKIAPTLVGGSKKHGGPDLGPTRARKAWAELGVNGLSLAADAPEPEFVGMPRLTVPMVARVQGFPDEWLFSGKKTNAYRQVGNAFPPPVAHAVARQIKLAILASHGEQAMQIRRIA